MKRILASLSALIFSLPFMGCMTTRQKERLLSEQIRREKNSLSMKFVVSEDGILEQYNGSEAEVEVPDGIRVIGQGAFRKSLVEYVYLPDSVVEIQKDAFADCQLLKQDVLIPESVRTLGEGIFRQCMNLEFAALESHIERVPDNMFASCTKLRTVVICHGVKHIGKSFTGCTSLEEIEIPDSVETIADFAFSGCSNLKYITLPESVKIGRRAFYGTQIENRAELEARYGTDIFY